MKLPTLLVFFLVISVGYTQNVSQIDSDSLLSKSFEYLKERYFKVPTNEEANLYANAILKKGKAENNIQKMIEAYEFIGYYYGKKEGLAYADSMTMYSEKVKDYKLEDAYMLKGYINFRSRNYTTALKNFTKAYPLAQENNNKSSLFKIRYNIASIDKIIGDYKSSKEKLSDCYTMLKDDAPTHDVYTIDVLYSLAYVYEKEKLLDSAAYFMNLGLKETTATNRTTRKPIFQLIQSIISYRKNAFQESIQQLEEIVSKMSNFRLLQAHYYLGSSYHQLKNQEKTIYHFRKMDSVFQKNRTPLSEARNAYTILLQHYDSIDDVKNAYYYSKRLNAFDSIEHIHYKHLNNKIIKDYNIPNYKNTISTLAKDKKNYKSWIIVSLIVIVIISTFLSFQYYKRRVYKKRFNELMQKYTEKQTETKTQASNKEKTSSNQIELPQEIIDEILEKLKDFEAQKLFITKNITLTKLAKQLQTNHTYLSRVINMHEDKGFVKYINDLRIDYALEQFMNDAKFKKYTISAIAEECGFSSSRSFSRAFHRKTGLQTSFFIKQLQS